MSNYKAQEILKVWKEQGVMEHSMTSLAEAKAVYHYLFSLGHAVSVVDYGTSWSVRFLTTPVYQEEKPKPTYKPIRTITPPGTGIRGF